MQYYRFFPGDYVRDTRRLSLAQHGAYRLLIDEYMMNGKLPNDLPGLYRICGAFNPDEQEAVQYVLTEFFVLDGPVWTHKRCEEELSWQEERAAKAAESSAIAVAAKKKKAEQKRFVESIGVSNDEPNGKPNGKPDDYPRDIPNQNQNQNLEPESLKPKTEKPVARTRRAEFPPPAGVEVETWEAFVRHRKSKRAAITDDGYRMLCRRLAGFREQGHDPGDVLTRSIEQGWTGIFEPQQGKGTQRKTRDDERAATLAALTGRQQPADGGGRIIDITPGHASDVGGPDLFPARGVLRGASG